MSKKHKRPIIMGLPNPEAVRRDQERRRSGAAGAHKGKWDNERRKLRQQLKGMAKCNLCD